ncbi:MAG: hypothetical protein ACOC9Y_03805, partial [Chloroflexota bacterium]
SGLLPFAPWVLLGLFAGRKLRPAQRAALILILINVSVIALRAGSWMSWGPPGRYLLPVVPLVLLFAVPGAARLWSSRSGRLLVLITGLWSALLTIMLHWLPLSGYIAWPRYLIDETWRAVVGWSPMVIFPTVEPAFGGTGYRMIGVCIIAAAVIAAFTLGVKLVKNERRDEVRQPHSADTG